MIKVEAGELIVPGVELDADRMPQILSGQATRAVEKRIERFFFSVSAIFEAW